MREWLRDNRYGYPVLSDDAERADWRRIVAEWKRIGASARLAHCLANAGCETVRDTLRFERAWWLREPNFGRKSWIDLEELRIRNLEGPLILTFGEWRPGEERGEWYGL